MRRLLISEVQPGKITPPPKSFKRSISCSRTSDPASPPHPPPGERLQHRPHAPVPVAAGFPPDAGDRLLAVRAQAVGPRAVLGDEESVAANHSRVAVVAARVLPLPHLPGQVAWVHV